MPRTRPFNNITIYSSISRRKRLISFLLILAINLLFPRQSSFAQHAPRQLFFVVSLPAVTHYNPGKLNAELASLKDKESVLSLIRSKNFPPAKILIGIQKDTLNSIPWTIYTSQRGPVRDDNRIILQSKDIPVSRISDPANFKSLLRDTIGVIDSLVLEIDIRNEDFPPNKYRLRSGCQADSGFPVFVPYADGHLLFSPRSVHACPEGLSAVKLFNMGAPDRTLASFRIVFLDKAQKEMLLDWASFLKSSYPQKSLKEIAESVSGYSANNFGRLSFDQLIGWLQSNLH